ncbi:UDP-N-acetyl-D-glucosamine 2-epimerase, UDP-hydrolysing [Halothiobacillus diazotrophicus]|uniref:UDP-N-acetyl-D-glucosamine 2-epimerase, UDP-hydrolysing n=1 Tax=Halothiobacillus diazotrophicus TaxID=1860122 RepID=A0A191ZGX2_9GAMM|nr:UDP-N-acetylglucosamine 2-epimerase [Halothiobacillus diazotrophicus]ANJ67136.1 UDP-N-acetyl-D-glucosamine 2-epimerase, UDP-hydrolysing [Halothiobacillus diazotrophicus]
MMRRIAVVTGTRADYGLLYWLIHDLHQAQDLELQLIVTGMHLVPLFGHTVDVIEQDGFPIAARVDIDLDSDEPEAVARSTGLATIGLAEAFARLRPDIVVILGDRFEMLAAASAAFIQRVPIAHIHGGEVTEGALDEGFRHAITKLAHLHFTAAEPYRRRVIQMGESPERVFEVGAPGLDHLRRTPLLSRAELEASLGFPLGQTNFLVTFHPATLDVTDAATQCRALLTALDAFPEATVVITLPNADPGGRAIIPLLEAYAGRHAGRVHLRASLGQLRYLSLLCQVQTVIGNSSSGIIEAPSFGAPTVNIGDRQQGRLRAASVIDCAPTSADIVAAIRRSLSADFRAALKNRVNPYGAGDATGRMMAVLRQVDLDTLRRKTFYDLPSECV